MDKDFRRARRIRAIEQYVLPQWSRMVAFAERAAWKCGGHSVESAYECSDFVMWAVADYIDEKLTNDSGPQSLVAFLNGVVANRIRQAVRNARKYIEYTPDILLREDVGNDPFELVSVPKLDFWPSAHGLRA